MGDFTMPSLGADMDKGTLTEWRVAPGDEVQRGDIVAVIQTEKSDVDVEVFETGVVTELLVDPGTEVAVGTPLARIEPADAAATPATPHVGPPPDRRPGAMPPPKVRGGRGHPHASAVLSPVVRHLAQSLQVDLDRVVGTGPGGRVTRADVEAAAAPTPPVPAAPRAPASPAVPAAVATDRRPASPLARRMASERGIDLTVVTGSGPEGAIRAADLTGPVLPMPRTPAVSRDASMRTAIARLMSTANREIPHYHVTSTIDVEPALSWLDERNAALPPGERVLPAALLLRAVAVAMAATPELNGWWEDGEFRPADHVDVGVAISLRGGGVVTPTITEVEAMPLAEVMAALRGLVTRSRRGNLRGSDLHAASVTVTNLGEQGAEEVLGVIHPPQVALVGLGRPVPRPVAVDGLVLVNRTIRATLSGDHRATDGHAGSRFLAALERALARPEDL